MNDPIKLTKLQREEIAHLHEIALSESDPDNAHPDETDSHFEGWLLLAGALGALLEDLPLSAAEAERARKEIEWHAGKWDDAGFTRSMDNLIAKIDRAVRA